ncbi:MAG: flagellar biosynthesis repressor FlbT [Proteobacteria bacterium]|nr:flagellar biosynthesis repressor FlbT [Pseudomonadota bacterium]
MSLKIEIKPGEKFVVNGAVIVAGKNGASLVLQNKAVLLREKDIMQEVDANTPARHIYFTVMLMYLDAENHETYHQKFVGFLEEYLNATTLPHVRRSLLVIHNEVSGRRFYQALKLCKALVEFETELFEKTPALAERTGT